MRKWRDQCSEDAWSKEKRLWERRRSPDPGWGQCGAVNRGERSTEGGTGVRLRLLLERLPSKAEDLDLTLPKALPGDHRAQLRSATAQSTSRTGGASCCGVEHGCPGNRGGARTPGTLF